MSAKPEVTPIPIDLINIAFDAVFKVDALAKVLLKCGPIPAEERDLVVDELVSRIEELNLIVMSVLGNDSSPANANELYRQVHREPMPEPEEECVD